jgi:hypothetical protein
MSKNCPAGTRKICECVKNPSPKISTRCPNGTRKNKSGDCVKYTRKVDFENKMKKQEKVAVVEAQKLDSPKISRKRKVDFENKMKKQEKVAVVEPQKLDSPKISRKRKVDFENKMKKQEKAAVVETKKSDSPNTPRKNYAKRYFQKPIMLLEKNKLFQVSIDIDQFKDYVNISNIPDGKYDCVIQSLFSLGLRDVKKAKRESLEINENLKRGIVPSIIAKYLTSSFGLPDNSIVSKTLNIRNSRLELADEEIIEFFNKNLLNNHATFFNPVFEYEGKKYGHAMIIYKDNDVIYYFNPQNKRYINHSGVIARHLEFMYNSSTFKLASTSYFSLPKVIKKPIPYLHTECILEYKR